MASKRRVVASISSWFCVPEQGMKDLEILSRGSCFIVPKMQEKNGGPKFHVLTASHIVSPWRWPKFYPDEWLQYLNERHTHYTMELRHEDGSFITQSELVPTTYHHPSRDVAALHLDDEDEAMDMMGSLGFTPLELVDAPPLEGQELIFRGHEVLGEVSESADERRPIPCDVGGRVQLRSPAQTFAATDKLLHDGMCGGPVTAAIENALGMTTEKVAGIVEGIVGADSPAVDYRGLAVFLEAHDMAEFLRQIEEGKCESENVLRGGEAAAHVSADQDPDKMDWKSILEQHADK